MLEFNFDIRDRERMLDNFALQLGVELNGDLLQFPPEFGTGYIRREKLPNKLDAIIYEFELNSDIWLNRNKADQEYYIFICQEIMDNSKMITEVDQAVAEKYDEQLSQMYLLSFLSDLRQFIPVGSKLRGFRVFISPEWLTAHLRIEKMDDVLRKYLQLKARTVHMKSMDVESRQLLEEILHPPADLYTDVHAYLQNRITMILENFFRWLYQHLAMEKGKGMSKADIELMRSVEKMLLSDLAVAPGLDELARSVAISVTKLKTMFKQVYGLPPFEYFQQHRMLKAKQLLLETDLAVNTIGAELGYRNMSNFILAFRKVFHINPGELRSKRLERANK